LDKDFKTSSLDSNIIARREDDLSQLGFEINSSLSTIYGSVEVLKGKKKNIDDETSKYLDLIQKGGQRIQKALRNCVEAQASEKPSVQKELQEEKVTA
jgi:signal transduction histidine kinase